MLKVRSERIKVQLPYEHGHDGPFDCIININLKVMRYSNTYFEWMKNMSD
jgi:hypothetical protein